MSRCPWPKLFGQRSRSSFERSAPRLTMADFDRKSAIFGALAPKLGATGSTALRRIAVRMAELLMNSAIPSEGSMQTSWPALRNQCYANRPIVRCAIIGLIAQPFVAFR